MTRLPGQRGHRAREWFYCHHCGRFTDSYGRYGRIRVPPCDVLRGEHRQLSIFPLLDPNYWRVEQWIACNTFTKETVS